MGKDANEIHVASDGGVYAADVGATMPSALTTDPEQNGFVNLGFFSEDGVTFTDTPTVEDLNAWQSSDPVRRLVTSRILTVSGSMIQVNQENFLVAFGGGEFSSPGSGLYRYDPPAAQDPLAESALVIRSLDGTKQNQYEVFRANVTEAVESQLSRSSAQQLPVTWSALTPAAGGASWGFLTDDAYAFGYIS